MTDPDGAWRIEIQRHGRKWWWAVSTPTPQGTMNPAAWTTYGGSTGPWDGPGVMIKGVAYERHAYGSARTPQTAQRRARRAIDRLANRTARGLSEHLTYRVIPE